MSKYKSLEETIDILNRLGGVPVAMESSDADVLDRYVAKAVYISMTKLRELEQVEKENKAIEGQMNALKGKLRDGELKKRALEIEWEEKHEHALALAAKYWAATQGRATTSDDENAVHYDLQLGYVSVGPKGHPQYKKWDKNSLR